MALFFHNIASFVTIECACFMKIWEKNEVSTEWKRRYLVKLPKKGDLSLCLNYRRIALLSIPGKVFNRVLLNKERCS